MSGLIPKRRRGRPKSREECSEPTPQTLAKLQRDQLSRLLAEGEINPDQERAARKIHSFTMALRSGSVPTSQLERGLAGYQRRAPRSPTERLSKREAHHWSGVYSPWAKAMNREVVARRPNLSVLGLIEKIVNENQSPEILAQRYFVPRERILRHMQNALDSYNAHNREKNIL